MLEFRFTGKLESLNLTGDDSFEQLKMHDFVFFSLDYEQFLLSIESI